MQIPGFPVIKPASPDFPVSDGDGSTCALAGLRAVTWLDIVPAYAGAPVGRMSRP